MILLTGGANGIGAATVRAFAEQGAVVEFCDRDQVAGKTLAGEVENARLTRVDLAQDTAVEAWVTAASKRSGTPYALISNAAIDPRIPLDEITGRRLDEVLGINLRPMFSASRAVATRMSNGGSIINLSSITFHTAPAEMSAYVASKGAIIGFTRSLAHELGAKGIRVNTVSPGWVMTDRQLKEYVDASVKRKIKRAQCVPELLQPREIAEVILFLASGASRAITGQEILADRGWAHS